MSGWSISRHLRQAGILPAALKNKRYCHNLRALLLQSGQPTILSIHFLWPTWPQFAKATLQNPFRPSLYGQKHTGQNADTYSGFVIERESVRSIFGWFHVCLVHSLLTSLTIENSGDSSLCSIYWPHFWPVRSDHLTRLPSQYKKE